MCGLHLWFTIIAVCLRCLRMENSNDRVPEEIGV